MNRRVLDFRRRALKARMSSQRKRRGVALILVLGAIVILTVFVTDLQVTSSATLSAAFSERDTERAEYHARSAINLTRLMIGAEPTIRGAIAPVLMAMLNGKGSIKQLPVWKFADTILGPFNDPDHAKAFASSAGVDMSKDGGGKALGLMGGHFELKIVDEDSKIDVNSAVAGDAFSRQRLATQLLGLMAPPKYTPMFEEKDSDGQYSDRATICGAMIDWSDYDETFYPCDPFGNAPQNDAVEDNYYQQVGLPYLRKNAPFDSLDELRLVRGVSDSYWSTFVDPEPDDPDQRILTVWGQGQINVNTANGMTLLAVVCAGAPDAKLCNDLDEMERFVQAITFAKAAVPGLPLFGSPRMFTRAMQGQGSSVIASVLQALQIDPVTWRSEAEVQKSVVVESKVFSIYAEGVVPRAKTKDKCSTDGECQASQTCHEGFCWDATRQRIHAVVDFRNAAPLGAQAGTGTTSATGGTAPATSGIKNSAIKAPPKLIPGAPGAPSSGTPPPSTSTSGQPSNSDVMAALLTDPAGQIIYYRIE